MGKFVVAAVVLGWLGIATAFWFMPVTITQVDGTAPKQETYQHGCPFDEPGMTSCEGTVSYLWRLPADGERTVTTTWQTDRSNIETLTGTLILDTSTCPDSRVEWTMTPWERTGGTLTDDNPAARLEVAATQPLDQITLTVRRLDTAQCGSTLRWNDPTLKPSFTLLP